MNRMRASQMTGFGFPAPAVQWVENPTVVDGEVLVRVVAAGLNPIDNGIRLGRSPYAHPTAFPAIVGTDMAGIVEAVGRGVKGFRPGQRVYGLTGGVGRLPGSLAEFVSVDPALLALAPAALPLREAAAMPLVTLTAWEGLVDRMAVAPGQTLLVQGGAGGVGHMAIQLAHAFGAHVWASCSEAKVGLVRSLGATPIDYAAETVEAYVAAHTGGQGFDLVYDTAGGDSLQAAFKATRIGGTVTSCAAFGSNDLTEASLRRLTLEPLYVLHPMLSGQGRERHGEILTRAARLADRGLLRPIVDPRRFTLDSLSEAYTALTDGTAHVKIVVDISAEPSPPDGGTAPPAAVEMDDQHEPTFTEGTPAW